jgi:hypothetical protein
MGLLKDAGDTFIKFGSLLVNKTEDYTRIARLNIEITRLRGDIEKVKAEIGGHVIELKSAKKSRLDLNSDLIESCVKKINTMEKQIGKKKDEIEEIKKRNSSPEPVNNQARK